MSEYRNCSVTGYLSSVLNTGKPRLAAVLRVFGILNILGGLILCIESYARVLSSRYFASGIAYSTGLVWLWGGMLSGILLFAAASALTSIRAIQDNTTMLRVSLQVGSMNTGSSTEKVKSLAD